MHNDACYPAIVVIGQLIDALQSGRCDPKRTALMLAQTCGPCRATNYPALLRKALCEAGFGDVPVLTLSGGSLNRQPGFAISARLLHRLILGCLYGDSSSASRCPPAPMSATPGIRTIGWPTG